MKKTTEKNSGKTKLQPPVALIGEKSPTTGWRKTRTTGARKQDHFAHISKMVGIKQNELKME